MRVAREREQMDDGDVWPAGKVHRIEAAAVAAPRLAWRPWLRGFVLGVVVGALVVAIIGYFILASLAEKVGEQAFGWWR